MTVSALHPPVVIGCVAAARESIDTAASVPAGALDEEELTDALTGLVALEAQVAAFRLEMLAEADRRKMAEQTADPGTAEWAARLTGTTRAVMAGGIWLSNLLREKYPATRDAFASGAIGEDQVRVVVRAAETLPAGIGPEQRSRAEAELVAKASGGMNSRRLRQAARRMAEVISRELADAHEAHQLAVEEERAELETWLSLHDNGDGTFSGRFMVPELHGHLLRNLLERRSGQRRLGRNRAGEEVSDPTLPGEGQTLSWTERLGAAFTELLEHLPTDGQGPVGATLVLTLDYERLVDGLGSAGLDTGCRISAGEARRIACGAGIVPMVLGGRSEVLDGGREQRLFSTGQRRALSLRHHTCAAEGCERPFAWCDVHHPHSWSRGGTTDLDNALPLCGHHHRRAHDAHFTMRVLSSGEARFRRRT